MLPPETLAAYHNTSYRVDAPGGSFVLRIGRMHPEFGAALAVQGADRWAFVTAWNPRSTLLSHEENAARHERLIERVHQLGFAAWPGEGAGDAPGWAPEVSLLILGIGAAPALELGREFEQHAIVVGTRGEPAELQFPFWFEVEDALRKANLDECRRC